MTDPSDIWQALALLVVLYALFVLGVEWALHFLADWLHPVTVREILQGMH